MKIAFYGNICNTFYQMARGLNEDPANEAHLYIEADGDVQMRPESDDPSLRGSLPEWIHDGDWMRGSRRVRSVVAPWSLPIVRELNRYDRVVLSGEGMMLASFMRPPVWFVTSGGDVTVLPFPRRALGLRTDAGLAFRVGVWPRALWMRRGIRAATKIWTQPFRPFMDSLARLGIAPDRIHAASLRVPIDNNGFRRLGVDEARALVPGIGELEDSDFVLFHPSRLMIRDGAFLRETGQWKANDLLLQGFARFCSEGKAKKPRLVLLDRTFGGDINLAREIIERLGIGEHVVWMRPSNPEGYTRSEMRAFYSIADAVADDFGAGWFGAVVLEGCAAGCPIVTFVDEEAMAKMYPWHPLLNARAPEQICARLRLIHEHPDEARRIGARSREWVDTFHATQAVIASNAEMFRNEPD